MSLERFGRKPLATVTGGQTILEAAERLHEYRVGAVVVVDGEKPVGMLTDRDIVLRCVAERKDPARTSVESVMSPHPIVARRTDLIDSVMNRMRHERVRRVPIVDAEGRLCGIVTMDDLVVMVAAELGEIVAAVRSNRGP